MAMYKPQQKHKSMHGGYRKKPTKSEVKGNLELLKIMSKDEIKPPTNHGIQLKLDL